MHTVPFHDSALLSLVNKIFTSLGQVFFPALIVLVKCGKFEKTAKDFKSDVWC